MRTKILAGLAFAASAMGATSVCETRLVGSDGKPAQGYIEILPNVPFTAAGGARVEQVKSTVDVRNGRFCVSLERNDTGTPVNTTYLVSWHLDGAAPRPEVWQVRTGTSPVSVGTVLLGTPPPPTYLIQPSQIGQAGAAPGQAFVWDGTAWVPGNVAAGPHAASHAAPSGTDQVTLRESQVTGLVSDLAGKAASNAAATVNGQTCALGSSCTVTAVPASVVPESLGGTGANNVPGAAGHVLRSDGTHYLDAAIQAGDVPALPESKITGLTGDLASKAPSASPDLTGDATSSGVLLVGDPRKGVPFMNPMAGTAHMAFLATGGEFVGTGLNDLGLGTVTSGYTGSAPAAFLIKISSTGTPDQFQWAKGNGVFSAPISITGGVQAISEGLTIQYNATTGHTLGDEWVIPTAAGMLWLSTLEEIGMGGATASLGSGAGNVTNGVHQVRYSWATGQGDTYLSNPGNVTVTDSSVNGKISITGIPQSTSALFIGTNIWITKAGGTQLYLAAFLPAGTTSFTFNIADSLLVHAAPGHLDNLPTAGGCIYGELSGFGWGSCALQLFDYGARLPLPNYYLDSFPNGLLGTSGNWLTQFSTTGSGTSVALSNSPALTGTPTVPTAAPGTNTAQVASTAYADAGLALKVSTSAVGVTVASLDGSTTVPQAQLPRCTTVVSFSSTPNFDFSTCPNQKITLTGNIAPTTSNRAYCQRGCTVTIVQGASSYAVTWDGGTVLGGFAIGNVNGGRNAQGFTSDGANLIATSYGVIDQ